MCRNKSFIPHGVFGSANRKYRKMILEPESSIKYLYKNRAADILPKAVRFPGLFQNFVTGYPDRTNDKTLYKKLKVRGVIPVIP